MDRYIDLLKPIKFRTEDGEIKEMLLNEIANIVEIPYADVIDRKSWDSLMSENVKLREVVEGRRAFVFSVHPFYLVHEGKSVLCRITSMEQRCDFNQQPTININAVIIEYD